jgi:hypothetical protein
MQGSSEKQSIQSLQGNRNPLSIIPCGLHRCGVVLLTYFPDFTHTTPA